MKLTETGTLDAGIEVDGVWHKEFEVRERLLRDSYDLYEKPELLAKCEASDRYAGLVVTGQRLKVGSLPEVTPEMLLDMTESDFELIQSAIKRLDERRRSFRAAVAAQSADGTAPAETGA